MKPVFLPKQQMDAVVHIHKRDSSPGFRTLGGKCLSAPAQPFIHP